MPYEQKDVRSSMLGDIYFMLIQCFFMFWETYMIIIQSPSLYKFWDLLFIQEKNMTL